MADELIQKLGWDTSDALAALSKMDEQMGQLEGRFGSLGQAMSTWNSGASATIGHLKEMATYATSAASAMEKLGSSMSKHTQAPAAPIVPPAPAPSSKLWLPPGVAEQMKKDLRDIAGEGENIGKVVPGGFAPIAPAVKPAKDASLDFLVSLRTLSRVVFTQAIVRGLSMVRDAFQEAVSSNLEFSTRISELNAIMGGPIGAIESLKKETADLASASAFPVGQVVEAEYQAVSAAYTNAADRAQVMSAATDLARVGCMSLNTATNLVTGGLRAYGMEANQSSVIAGKFFQVIRDGRVRGEEIAATWGKVMSTAHALGVSLDDVGASTERLTVAGVKPAEAITSLRSVMVALAKDSGPLHEALKKNFGADSGEQFIAMSGGLIGALQSLANSQDNDLQSILKLIPNVRALNAILTDTGPNANAAAAGYDNMRKSGAALLESESAKFKATDAFRLNKEINDLKTYIATDLGESLVQSLAKIVDFVGGVGTLKSAISAVIGPATVFVGAITAIGTYFALASMQAKAATFEMKAFGFAASGAITVLAGWATFNFVDTKMHEATAEAARQFEAEQDEEIKKKDALNRERIRASDELYGKIVQRGLQYIAQVSKVYDDELDAAKKSDGDLVASTKSTMEQLISAKEKGSHLLRDLAKEDEKDIEKSQKRTLDLQAKLADTRFDVDLKKKAAAYKDAKEAARAEEAAYLARSKSLAVSVAGAPALIGGYEAGNSSDLASPENQEKADLTLKRAEAYAQLAASAAKASGDIRLQEEAEQTIENLLGTRLQYEEAIRKVKAEQAQAAAQAAAKEEQQANQMRVLAKQIAKEANQYDEKGNLKSAEHRTKDAAAFAQDTSNFLELAFSQKWDASKLLDYASLRSKMADNMKAGVTDVQIRDMRAAPGTLAKLNEQITHGLGIIPIYAKVAGLSMEEMKDKTVQQARAAAEQKLKDQQKASTDYQSLKANEQSLQREINKTRELVQGSSETNVNRWDKRMWEMTKIHFGSIFTGDSPKETREMMEDRYRTLGEIRNASTMPETITKDQVEAWKAKAQGYNAFPLSGAGETEGLISTNVERLQRITELEEQRRKTQQQIRDKDQGPAVAGESHLRQLNDTLPGRVSASQDLADATKDVGANTGQAAAETSKAAARTAAWAEQVKILKAAYDGVQVPIVAGQLNPQTAQARGGAIWNFLAGGGFPRGTDTVRAMLSPGEMVINAGSARKFSSQLTAMNAGVRPSYHTHGGSVTNVGDINVSVSGGGSARQTGRSIATELRRELRRGSSIL
jgi:TP901 family phage tail tape measure protein